MNKLQMQTPNIVDNNVEKISKLFPEVVTEIKDKEGNLVKGIDFDLLKQKLSNRKFGNTELSAKPTNFYNLDLIISVGSE